MIFHFSFFIFHAQNLVYNPSFEEHSACPSWGRQLPLSIGWSAPSNNSAEYFHSCSFHTSYSVPYQGLSNFQFANTGEAFVGIISYNAPGSDYREYAQGFLIETLSLNRSYSVSFFINRPSGNFGGKYAINNIALSFQNGFSDTNSNSSYSLGYTMDVYKFGNPIINDTANWVKIEGVYKANGTENFVVIGNFKLDNETDTLNTFEGSYPAASYFIDDVSVEEITEPFWQYRDTTINYGDSVLIGPAITGLDINWYTANDEFIENAPGIYVKPESSRNYIARETFNDIETNHLVHVTVLGGAGVAENKLEQLVVYPNPNKGTFSLSGLFPGKTELKIVNLAGQTVWLEEANFTQNEEKITVDLEKGVYFLEVRNLDSEKRVKRKIVIK